MGLILDTSVCIAAERGGVDFNQWQQYGQAYISAITVTELLVGVHCANTVERELKRSVFVERIISALTILPYTQAEARLHARLLSQLFQQHITIGAHDLIIGATALTHGFSILTANTKDFERIPGVQVLAL